MFIHAVPDNRGKKDGYYCSLVESKRKDGKPVHNIKYSFGFISSDRLPYLKAAFNEGNPSDIFENEVRRLEKKTHSSNGSIHSHGKKESQGRDYSSHHNA